MKKQINFKKLVILGALGLTIIGTTTYALDKNTYKVKESDTLSQISPKLFNSLESVNAVAQLNKIKDQHFIQASQKFINDETNKIKVAKEKEKENENQSQSQSQSLQTNEAVKTTKALETSETVPVHDSQVEQQSVPAQTYSQSRTGTVQLSNGNTPGATGAYAAAEMEKRTGVPASTWEYIIARESNGQVTAQNPSGASGLFQTMPFHGSTATVEDQINSAVNAYKSQGLSAWGV